ncbi:MAG: dATP/dGTP diphosphohydrolase domain-containing protein [Pseudomonadota bacterium]
MNNKDAAAKGKIGLSAVPCNALFWTAAACEFGARKYGRHNWREEGLIASVYYDAMMRHAMRYYEGEKNDPDSELPHLAHVAATALILLDGHEHGLIDDRPHPRLDFIEEIQRVVDGWVDLDLHGDA